MARIVLVPANSHGLAALDSLAVALLSRGHHLSAFLAEWDHGRQGAICRRWGIPYLYSQHAEGGRRAAQAAGRGQPATAHADAPARRRSLLLDVRREFFGNRARLLAVRREYAGYLQTAGAEFILAPGDQMPEARYMLHVGRGLGLPSAVVQCEQFHSPESTARYSPRAVRFGPGRQPLAGKAAARLIPGSVLPLADGPVFYGSPLRLLAERSVFRDYAYPWQFGASAADRVYVMGPWHHDELVRRGLDAGRIKVTGPPAGDALLKLAQKRAASRRPAGERVLIGGAGLRENRPALGDVEIAGMRSIVRSLARALPQARFVIKNHPDEADDKYAELRSELVDIVSGRESITPQLLEADAYIAGRSSSLFEAHALDVPAAIVDMPGYETEQDESPFTESCPVFDNPYRLAPLVRQWLGQAAARRGQLERQQAFWRHYALLDGNATTRIVALVEAGLTGA